MYQRAGGVVARVGGVVARVGFRTQQYTYLVLSASTICFLHLFVLLVFFLLRTESAGRTREIL